ncbi:MAG: elongation factor P maturation arginine rhamnosyltransferase EarP [Burkholderiaceae bacterium]|nr:elongation factor P maturation arginine rhamnosyltransferase EarP [Rhodoferax sp.]MCP5284614.1 elongation factor P maturation arginine rhamnosyltransferase EarP [Burkholderiaceae bacterium]
MAHEPNPPLVWDLFCRVIDNFGDIGVCWRLAADLAGRGDTVRLWVDDASALRWMAPQGAQGVQVGAFDAAGEPGAVVVEAFGCDPPAAFVARMAARADRPPVWVNLEYLSAEAWVERAHGLPSPQANGLHKWFFFPGFTAATGGLLREPGLLQARERFERPDGPRRAVVFSYDTPALASLAEAFDGDLWLCPGPAQVLAPSARVRHLPTTDQPGFDRWLWSADVNIVRGEDSLVRALWAGTPFIWHIYPQHDGVHRVKLDALLDRLAADDDVRALWHAWNGFGPWPTRWPDEQRWRAATEALRTRLADQVDLVTQLRRFVAGKLTAAR